MIYDVDNPTPELDAIMPCDWYDGDGNLIDKRIKKVDTETGVVKSYKMTPEGRFCYGEDENPLFEETTHKLPLTHRPYAKPPHTVEDEVRGLTVPRL